MPSPKASTGQADIELDADPANSEITTPADLGFTTQQPQHAEIEVEAIQERPSAPDPSGLVEIRMSRTIEEFTHGNPQVHYRLDEGKRYRLPVQIANYLYQIGAVFQRS